MEWTRESGRLRADGSQDAQGAGAGVPTSFGTRTVFLSPVLEACAEGLVVAESSELCPEAPQGACEAGTSHACLGVLRQGLGGVSREQAQGGAGARPPPRAAPCGPVAMPRWLPGHPPGGSQLWSLWPRARGERRKLWVALQDGRSGGVCLAPGSTDTRDQGMWPGESPHEGYSLGCET